MASLPRQHPPTVSKKPSPPQLPIPPKTLTPDSQNPKPNPFPPSPQHLFLSNSPFLSHQDVLCRRSHNIKQLWRCYRDYYWSLMEEVKLQHREYYWKYGVSPFKAEVSRDCALEAKAEYDESGFDGDNAAVYRQCAALGCKTKAMALTRFCFLHILSDPDQRLYKPCDYVIKRAQTGPITCGKPILKSVVPGLCSIHLQKAQKHLQQALKKSGLSATSSSKPAPKLHVIAAEYVQQIQEKRRAGLRPNKRKVEDQPAIVEVKMETAD